MLTRTAATRGRAETFRQEWYRRMSLCSKARLPKVKLWVEDQVEQSRHGRLATDVRTLWLDSAYSTDRQTNDAR